jgi:hypothetical protein
VVDDERLQRLARRVDRSDIERIARGERVVAGRREEVEIRARAAEVEHAPRADPERRVGAAAGAARGRADAGGGVQHVPVVRAARRDVDRHRRHAERVGAAAVRQRAVGLALQHEPLARSRLDQRQVAGERGRRSDRRLAGGGALHRPAGEQRELPRERRAGEVAPARMRFSQVGAARRDRRFGTDRGRAAPSFGHRMQPPRGGGERDGDRHRERGDDGESDQRLRNLHRPVPKRAQSRA